MPRLLLITATLILSFQIQSKGEEAGIARFKGKQTTTELEKHGFKPLFHNGDMSQWEIQPWHVGHWKANASVLAYDGQAKHGRVNRADLWTKKSFKDFCIYAEWRLPSEPKMKPHPMVLYNGDFLMQEDNPKVRYTRERLDAGDSGLYFRGSIKCQANIWSQVLGSGEINGYRTDRSMPPEVRRGCIPIRNADRPFGQWNAFLVTIRGNTMSVTLNGEVVIPGVALPNLPAEGPIALQHHGDPVEFGQIWVKELD